MLLPIAGVAVLGRSPRNAVQELVTAAAGPPLNVAIVALLLPVLVLLGEPLTFAPAFLRPDPGAALTAGEALRWLVGANVSLVLFNLIPAFPLDGGRILRGLLGLRMDWATATRRATAVGQTLAVAMGLYGLVAGHLALLVIAALVFVAAGATDAERRLSGDLFELRNLKATLTVDLLFPFAAYWWFSAGFTAFILLLLAVDLGVFHRDAHVVSFRESLAWSIVWVGLALAFNYGFYLYAAAQHGAGAGARLGLEFLTGYIVEKSLAVDNIFVCVIRRRGSSFTESTVLSSIGVVLVFTRRRRDRDRPRRPSSLRERPW